MGVLVLCMVLWYKVQRIETQRNNALAVTACNVNCVKVVKKNALRRFYFRFLIMLQVATSSCGVREKTSERCYHRSLRVLATTSTCTTVWNIHTNI